MFDKLDSIEKRFKELEAQLSDSTVMQDMKKYSELMKIKKERDQIERVMKLLSAKKVDTDLLEELLRQSLQYSRPNEKMIMIGDE